jgi:hypothetical protein
MSVLDSHHWKGAEVAAKMPFHLDGDAVPTSRTSSRRTWMSLAEGTVTLVEPFVVRIDGEAPIRLRHCLPPSFELGALLGQRVRVTLAHAATLDAGLTQTLSITGQDGRLLVLGYSGEARAMSHSLGRLDVYVAFSQRPGGPMVFGTSRLQSIVREGDHIRVRCGAEAYVMHFDSRRGRDATYAITTEELWSGAPSTMRSV